MFELNNFQTRISDVAIAAAAKQMILQMGETGKFKLGHELLCTDEKLYEEHFGFNPVGAGKHNKWSQPLPRGGPSQDGEPKTLGRRLETNGEDASLVSQKSRKLSRSPVEPANLTSWRAWMLNSSA